MTGNAPHAWVTQQPDDPEAMCRVCCLDRRRAGPECIPHPGNPERPFYDHRILLAVMSGAPVPAGPPIHSAPPDDDPVRLHILNLIQHLTHPAGWEPPPANQPRWRRILATGIRRLLPEAQQREIRRKWEHRSCQSLFEQGLLITDPFNNTFITGRHITGAELHQDGRTATIMVSNGSRIILRPSRRAPEFVAAVNRYARPNAGS